jgi:hypothetical protein
VEPAKVHAFAAAVVISQILDWTRHHHVPPQYHIYLLIIHPIERVV